MGLNLKFICARRKELGLQQSEVAEMLGMVSGAPAYSKYENGIYKLNAEMIPTLAKVLKCPISALFTDETEKPKAAEKTNLRGLFEEMTKKLITDVIAFPAVDASPEIIREIRENVRELGYF